MSSLNDLAFCSCQEVVLTFKRSGTSYDDEAYRAARKAEANSRVALRNAYRKSLVVPERPSWAPVAGIYAEIDNGVDQKIPNIKVIHSLTSLGLREAKYVVEDVTHYLLTTDLNKVEELKEILSNCRYAGAPSTGIKLIVVR